MKMLQNKRSVGILLVVAGLVWGVVLYRIAAYSSREQGVRPGAENRRVTVHQPDDSLSVNYRDPFAEEAPVKQVKTAVRRRAQTTVAEPDIPPAFRFAGSIRKGKQVFLLIVTESETRLMSARTKKIDGFRIERVYTDSIRVCRGNRKYTLCRE